MLRRTHVAPFTTLRGGTLHVDWLRDPDGRVVAFLDRLLRLARRLEGRTHGDVVEALRRQERRVRDARRLAGLAKTVLDLSTFRPPPDADLAPEARKALFLARGAEWPPTSADAARPWETAALVLNTTADRVRSALYADSPAARTLARAPRLDGHQLLARYNLELARAVLLDAERVTLTARGGWKPVFRAVKLARLMYRIERMGRSRRTWRVELTGPAAPFLTRPQRYGIRLARVLPALMRGEKWSIDAELVRGSDRVSWSLDASAPLPRPRRGQRFDSLWERSLARDFATRLGEEKRGWSLVREDAPVDAGGELFLPDFTLRHRDGRELLVEVVGFWTPEYLETKLRKIEAARLDNLVLLVFRGLAAGPEAAALERLAHVVWFANTPRIAPVLEAADRLARRP